ncbi:unnamed protein product [Calypogeia fissa]
MSAALSPSPSPSASPSPSRGVILEQLQSDAPQSPLVGHLRNRLNVPNDAAALLSSSSSLPSSLTSSASSLSSMNSRSSITSGSEVFKVHTAAASQVDKCEQQLSAKSRGAGGEAEDITRVTTHSYRPISADFLNGSSSSKSGGSQSRDPSGNAGHSASEGRRESESMSASSSGRPESYVLVHNVTKRHNLGTLARSATAFGVTELILVGRKDFNAFGSHGASLHIQFRHFHTLPEAALYLKANDVDICGVEIIDGARPVHKHPFTRSTAFVLGNEGTGLSKKEMDICSFFVYIPQCGSGTASLNVTVAASIVLHHFSVWAGFAEREREGQKFVVAERPVRRMHRNVVEDQDALKERRRLKADCGTDDWLLCDGEDENESTETLEGREIGTIEFPNSRRSGLLSSLNSLYS